MFRQESKHLGPDGKPLQQLPNLGPKKYTKAFNLLKDWIDNNLDIYKVSPLFFHMPYSGPFNVLTRRF